MTLVLHIENAICEFEIVFLMWADLLHFVLCVELQGVDAELLV